MGKKRTVSLLLNPPIQSLHSTGARGAAWRAPGALSAHQRLPLGCSEVGAGRQHHFAAVLPGMSVWCLPSVLCEAAGKLGKNILWVLIAGQLGQLIEQLNFRDWVDTHFNIYLKTRLQITNCSMEREIILSPEHSPTWQGCGETS